VERVRELIEPIIVLDGVQLYDVEHESGVLRIMVDRPGGIDVDTIGEVSQRISQLLDERDPIPDARYLLEVTSPGIERKLRTLDHYQAQVGSEVAVKLKAGIEGDRRFNGVLQSADQNGVDIEVEGTSGPEVRRLSYSDVDSARTVFHWGAEAAAASPGSMASPSKKQNSAKAKISKTPTKKASAR